VDPLEDACADILQGTRRYAESKERSMPCRWSTTEHSMLIAMLKKKGKKWQEIAEIIMTKNE